MTAYKLINVYAHLLSANNLWSTSYVHVIITFSGIFRGLKPQLHHCNIYEVPKHRILSEFMTRHWVFVYLCIIYEWKKAFVDVLQLPISSDQTDIVTTEIAGLGKNKRSLPKDSRAERQENMRERKYVQEWALRKLTRYLQLWLLPSHGISSISGQMQGRECCFSNEIIYLWKPTPAPGPKPIYQVWAAGGSSPGAINLPPVSPPPSFTTHPCPWCRFWGLFTPLPPLASQALPPHATRRCKAE